MKQFSLLSLMIGVGIVSVVYSACNQYRQGSRIHAISTRLAVAEHDLRACSRVNQLLMHFADGGKEIHFSGGDKNEFRILEWVKDIMFDDPTVQVSKVGGAHSGMEILSISNDSQDVPGAACSVNVLFEHERIVDVLVRETSTRRESHVVRLNDTDDDNVVELVFVLTEGFLGTEGAKSKLVYSVSETGFVVKPAGGN